MNSIFVEFENENSLRTYPFASGCKVTDTDGVDIGTGIFIDAALYPINPTGVIYLSKVTETGEVYISDATGTIMRAERKNGASTLEFYEIKGLGRHTGTLLAASSDSLDIFINSARDRIFKRESTEFAASCVFAIRNDGVLSLQTGDGVPQDGQIEFGNADTDDIRISTNSQGSELRFDVLPPPTGGTLESIKQIYCIVDGKTPFRIEKIPFSGTGSLGNTIAVYLDNIDKSVVCSNAHREDALVMTDTCDCAPSPTPEPIPIPDTYQATMVDIPLESDGSFYLTVPNILGYDNPLSIILKDGKVIPKPGTVITEDISGNKSGENSVVDLTEANSATIQVAGMS